MKWFQVATLCKRKFLFHGSIYVNKIKIFISIWNLYSHWVKMLHMKTHQQFLSENPICSCLYVWLTITCFCWNSLWQISASEGFSFCIISFQEENSALFENISAVSMTEVRRNSVKYIAYMHIGNTYTYVPICYILYKVYLQKVFIKHFIKTKALSKLSVFHLSNIWNIALKFVLRLNRENQERRSAEENCLLPSSWKCV